MRETGTVVQIVDDHIVVKMRVHGGCRRCAMNQLCSAKERRLTVRGAGEVKVGDLVEVEIPARGVMAAASVVFFIPLLLSLAASVVVHSLTGRWGWGITAFFVCLVTVEILAALMDRQWRQKRSFQPAMRRKISGEPADSCF